MKNNIQKIFFLTGVISFIFFIFSPLSVTRDTNDREGHPHERWEIHDFDEYFDEIIDDGEVNYFFKTWYQILSFSLLIVSILGFILFRNNSVRVE